MKNVLYVGPDYRNHRGGIGAVLEVYARHIRPFHFVPTYVTKSFPKKLAMYVAAILRLIWLMLTARQIRILHIHCASKGSFLRKSLIVLIGKLFGRKVILHIHGGGFHNFYSRSGFVKPIIRFVIERCDALICLSQVWKEYYSSHFKVPKIVIVNNVVEKPAKDLQPLPMNGHINFLFLGLITDKKGIFDLLDVVAENRDRFNGKLTITIGGNGETERLKQQISERHNENEVHFAGWVNGPKKAELLNSCDVYVLPSYNEGLPISILEAMTYGKPVIATEVGGVPEIVRPGYNGWLFKPGDKKGLENIIAEVLENPLLLKTYGDNSMEIAKNYTTDSVISSLEQLYNSLMYE